MHRMIGAKHAIDERKFKGNQDPENPGRCQIFRRTRIADVHKDLHTSHAFLMQDEPSLLMYCANNAIDPGDVSAAALTLDPPATE